MPSAQRIRALRYGATVCAALISGLLSGCGGEEGAAEVPPSENSNHAPTISGSPLAMAAVGREYRFTPSLDDVDGDSLVVSAVNLPAWLALDEATGSISGTPTISDLGQYGNVHLTVTDGIHTVTLGPFSVSVVASGTGSATLSWMPPTQNADGSPLADLAGYQIYWGLDPDEFSESISLENPGITTYVVDGLTSGTWYFAARAVNSTGAESAFSNTAQKTIP